MMKNSVPPLSPKLTTKLVSFMIKIHFSDLNPITAIEDARCIATEFVAIISNVLQKDPR